MIVKLEGQEILQKWRKNRPKERFPITLVLDNIRSAYNVGSIFRTAECAFIERLILCGITARPPHQGIEKTALGTTELVPWDYEESVSTAVKKLKDKEYTIASLELTSHSIPIQQVSGAYFPLALIIGNEVTGVSSEALELSDLILEIPLYGEKESLNVAVAVGVALFLLLEKFKPKTNGN